MELLHSGRASPPVRMQCPSLPAQCPVGVHDADSDACATASPTRRLDAKQEADLDDELQRVQQQAAQHAQGRRSRSVDPSPPPHAYDEPSCIPASSAGGCSEHGRPSLLRSMSHSHSSQQRNNSIDDSGAMSSSSCLSASSCSAASSASASGSASGQLSSAVATPCSSPPPIPFDPEMLSDADDVMVRGLRASHIAPQHSASCGCTSPTHSCSLVDSSPAPTITPSPSARSCTSDPFTPSRVERERNSRKRRNSRLHASKHAQSNAAAASTQMDESRSSSFKPVKSVDRSTDQMSDVSSTPYSPGQNKRSHTDGEFACSSSSSSAASASASTVHMGGGSFVTTTSSSSSSSVVSSNSNNKPHTLHIRVPSGSTHISVETAAPAASNAAAAAPAPGTRRPPLHAMPGLPAPSSSRSSLVSVLACVLEQLFSNPNDTLPSDPSAISMFHTASIPSISIGRYLDRIAHYAECSEESLVLSFIHISRIYHANQAGASASAGAAPLGGAGKPFQLNTLSIHRLLLVAIMTSSKFFDDLYYNNAFYAKIGGVTLPELNALEVEFLALIAFDLYVPSKIYKRFYRELTNKALHPYCSCAFRELPPELSYEEELPQSPMVDCDLHELTYGGGAGVYGAAAAVSTGPGGSRLPLFMPSPITPLVSTQHAFEAHGHAAQQFQQQQQQPQQPQQHAAAAVSSSSHGLNLARSHLDSSEAKHADSA